MRRFGFGGGGMDPGGGGVLLAGMDGAAFVGSAGSRGTSVTIGGGGVVCCDDPEVKGVFGGPSTRSLDVPMNVLYFFSIFLSMNCYLR